MTVITIVIMIIPADAERIIPVEKNIVNDVKRDARKNTKNVAKKDALMTEEEMTGVIVIMPEILLGRIFPITIAMILLAAMKLVDVKKNKELYKDKHEKSPQILRTFRCPLT